MSYENQAYGHGPGRDGGNQNSNRAGGLAPVIVTSPAPDTDKADEESNKNQGGQAFDTASSGSGGSRRGSASIGGEVCGLLKAVLLQPRSQGPFSLTPWERGWCYLWHCGVTCNFAILLPHKLQEMLPS